MRSRSALALEWRVEDGVTTERARGQQRFSPSLAYVAIVTTWQAARTWCGDALRECVFTCTRALLAGGRHPHSSRRHRSPGVSPTATAHTQTTVHTPRTRAAADDACTSLRSVERADESDGRRRDGERERRREGGAPRAATAGVPPGAPAAGSSFSAAARGSRRGACAQRTSERVCARESARRVLARDAQFRTLREPLERCKPAHLRAREPNQPRPADGTRALQPCAQKKREEALRTRPAVPNCTASRAREPAASAGARRESSSARLRAGLQSRAPARHMVAGPRAAVGKKVKGGGDAP